MTDALPRYLDELTHRLEALLGPRLVGVALGGSTAYGADEPGISDVDVLAVVDMPLDRETKFAVAARLTHAALPCPARKLEFVCYEEAALQPVPRHPRFEINHNTGAGEPEHLTLDPADESSHWFLLDLAVCRGRGRALFGPDPDMLIGPIPRRWMLEALLDGLAWHAALEPASANAVLNACRSWRYAATGVLGSKREGAEWAKAEAPARVSAVIEAALRERASGAPLPAEDAPELMGHVREAVRRALQAEG